MMLQNAVIHTKQKHTVSVTNEQDRIPVGLPLLRLCSAALDAALAYECFTEKTEVSLTFCDNARIHEMNLEFRNVDRPTDVLSFPMEEDALLGDIVISLEKAKEQGEAYGHSFLRECGFLFVHSVLHLLGYDHERSKEEEKDMFARQEAILQRIGCVR